MWEKVLTHWLGGGQYFCLLYARKGRGSYFIQVDRASAQNGKVGERAFSHNRRRKKIDRELIGSMSG